MKNALSVTGLVFALLCLSSGAALAADKEVESSCEVQEIDATPAEVKKEVDRIVANSTLIKIDEVEIIDQEKGVKISEATYLAVDNQTGAEKLLEVGCVGTCNLGAGSGSCGPWGCDVIGSQCTSLSCSGSNCSGGSCTKTTFVQ